MRGITEERLRLACDHFTRGEVSLNILHILLDECKELTPWQTIENAPLNKKIRVFQKYVKEQRDEVLLKEHDKELYSHWAELPEDPE